MAWFGKGRERWWTRILCKRRSRAFPYRMASPGTNCEEITPEAFIGFHVPAHQRYDTAFPGLGFLDGVGDAQPGTGAPHRSLLGFMMANGGHGSEARGRSGLGSDLVFNVAHDPPRISAQSGWLESCSRRLAHMRTMRFRRVLSRLKSHHSAAGRCLFSRLVAG